MNLLEINDDNVDILLKEFNKEVDNEGFIIDRDSRQRVDCRYTHKPIKKDRLGGILPGSSIFIEDSDVAYAGYVMEFLSNSDGEQ